VAINEFKAGLSSVNTPAVPNARSGFLEANAREVFALHKEHEAIGKSIAEWNVGIWVVTRGDRLGVFYGKLDAVRAMGPLRYRPRVELAGSEAHATALLDSSHPVCQLK